MVRGWEPSAELAVESPWRIAYEMATDDSPLTFWQSTVLIRDDGPTCHVAWGLVFDPEPSDDALAEAERLLEVMSAQLGDLAAGQSTMTPGDDCVRGGAGEISLGCTLDLGNQSYDAPMSIWNNPAVGVVVLEEPYAPDHAVSH